MSDSLEYIRKTYGVPARVGGRVAYIHQHGTEEIGVIIGAEGHYLRIRFGGEITEVSKIAEAMLFHPTWNLKYLEDK